MQTLEVGTYEVRKSDEGEVAIIIPNLNDKEYIQSIDLVSIDAKDGKLEIHYSFDNVVERKIVLKDVSVSTQFIVKDAKVVNVIELMHEETMIYQVIDIVS